MERKTVCVTDTQAVFLCPQMLRPLKIFQFLFKAIPALSPIHQANVLAVYPQTPAFPSVLINS